LFSLLRAHNAEAGMESKVTEQDEIAGGDSTWQRARNEIEKQWHTALHCETSDVVPSKLPISVPPVRRVA